MALRCALCGRKAMAGNSRSHSNIATRTKQNINLQSKRIDGVRTRVCTGCMKTQLRRK